MLVVASVAAIVVAVARFFLLFVEIPVGTDGTYDAYTNWLGHLIHVMQKGIKPAN